MTRLALAQAPPLLQPLRWLLAAPVWGMIAGFWLLGFGPAVLLDRWTPATVALVHLFVLGVLGNAMLGSLQQFLPVAAGTPPVLTRSSRWLHALYNLGIVCLASGLVWPWPGWNWLATGLIALPLLFVALALIPLLLHSGTQRVLRSGIALALAFLSVTVVLGVLLAFGLVGTLSLPLARLADLHAATGLFGWVLVLMASVASVTLPMFQGTVTIRAAWLAVWLLLLLLGIGIGGSGRLVLDSGFILVLALAPVAAAFVGASLGLPLRAPRRRETALVGFWRMGTLAFGAGCLAGLLVAFDRIPARLGLSAGALVIAIGLPMMLTGMMLEINGFLAWIRVRGECPRGVQVPGVGLLSPERDKRRVLIAHLVVLVALPAATFQPILAPVAGIALISAHAATLIGLLACQNRARRFAREPGSSQI